MLLSFVFMLQRETVLGLCLSYFIIYVGYVVFIMYISKIKFFPYFYRSICCNKVD